MGARMYIHMWNGPPGRRTMIVGRAKVSYLASERESLRREGKRSCPQASHAGKQEADHEASSHVFVFSSMPCNASTDCA